MAENLEITRIVRKGEWDGDILSVDINGQKFLPATPERENAGRMRETLHRMAIAGGPLFESTARSFRRTAQAVLADIATAEKGEK
jgi:hypothetical protein